MALAKNIIRINGYKDGKRTHVDVEVPMKVIDVNGHSVEIPNTLAINPVQKGFELGLDAVTSFNAYNWVGKRRITEKLV